MSRDPRSRLADASLVAIRADGEDWPHGRMKQTPIPESWRALVETRGGTRRMVRAGEDPNPGRDDRLLLVRTRPVSIMLTIADAVSADDDGVRGTCELLVGWPARDDDLAALRKTLMTSTELSLERLSREFDKAGAGAALRAFIRERRTEKLLREDQRAGLLDYLKKNLARFCFDAGVELQRVARLDLTSKTFEHSERLRREARGKLERIKSREALEAAAAAATERRLGYLGDVLAKLKSASTGDENMRWSDLLPALNPTERGKLLGNLWRITPNASAATAIVAVSGNECVWLNPTRPKSIDRRVSVPDDLGGLRSIRCASESGRLLVGAATGIWSLDADSGEVIQKYEVPEAGPQRTGFNAAAVVGDRLYATHSKLGCWSWANEDASGATAILQPAGGVPKAVRAVAALGDGRIVFSTDDCVQIYDHASAALSVLNAADDIIHCLAANDGKLYVGTADGKLLRCEIDYPDHWTVVQRAIGAIESVCLRRWTDLDEVILPAGSQGVNGVYGDDKIVARLMECDTPIRRAWASDDCVVGLSEGRDRLVVMHSSSSDRSSVEVPLARMTGDSIQDVCIVVKADDVAASENHALEQSAEPARAGQSAGGDDGANA